jgi:adenylyltransferase/sulfurtransferase
MPDWGENGQKKLKAAKILVAGAGGLGCPASLYLTAVGVGNLTIVDRDKYELSNLNRQILGWQKDIGRYKAEASKEKLKAFNPDIAVNALVTEITEDNVLKIIHDHNIVVDAMDNWETRFILNKACVNKGIPFIHAGIHGLTGQLITIVPGKGPCLRCIMPKTPQEIKNFPVLGATPGLFATLQVMEAVKIIVGIGEPLVGRMVFINGEHMSFTTFEVNRNPECSVCKLA